MSVILDALKKSERQRKTETGSAIDELDPAGEHGKARRWWQWAVAIVFALAVFGLAGAIKLQFLDLEPVVALFVPERTSERASEGVPDVTVPPPPVEQTAPSPTPAPVPESAPPEIAAPLKLPSQADSGQQPDKPANLTSAAPVPPLRLEPTAAADIGVGSKLTGTKNEPAVTALPAQQVAEGNLEVAAAPAEPEPAPIPMPKPMAASAATPSLPKPPPKPSTIPQPEMASGLTAEQHNERAQAFERDGLYDRAIKEYSQAILLRPQFTEAYYGRGWAHETTGAHLSAIRDFNRVIEQMPDFAGAYYGRGWAFERTGRIDQAITEYGETIRLEPGNTDAYLSRGILQFYSNRLRLAESDFDIVYERDSGSLGGYALLWTYLSRMRSGVSERHARSMIAGRKIKSTWPGVILSVYLGRAEPAQVIAETKFENQATQRQRECVAYFFLGALRLIKDDRNGAAEYFRKALATGVSTYRQYWAAEMELKKLEKAGL